LETLLLKPQTLQLGKSSHLVVEPEVILHDSKNRQGNIKGIVSRMPDQFAVPTTQEAAASG
jgi:hypothetical protein